MTKFETAKPVKTGTPSEIGSWIKHVQAYRQLHGVSFKVALTAAGDSYTKVVKVKKEKKDHKANPWMVHISAYKTAHPEWKDTMSYKQVLQACKLTYKSGAD
tara:strand:- start:540 stop:845 length:306 start_codon:yes stop_codon:yes gene_type:complete